MNITYGMNSAELCKIFSAWRGNMYFDNNVLQAKTLVLIRLTVGLQSRTHILPSFITFLIESKLVP